MPTHINVPSTLQFPLITNNPVFGLKSQFVKIDFETLYAKAEMPLTQIGHNSPSFSLLPVTC